MTALSVAVSLLIMSLLAENAIFVPEVSFREALRLVLKYLYPQAPG